MSRDLRPRHLTVGQKLLSEKGAQQEPMMETVLPQESSE
jgi:hypothetical protein